MKTRVIVLSTAAYAVIETKDRSMDVQLAAGRSAAQSLQETVDELREKARALNERADFIERAIAHF